MLDYILGASIAPYVKKHYKLLIIALLLTALSSIFVVIPAYILQPFVDEGMKSAAEPASWKLPWIVYENGKWIRSDYVIVENISSNKLLIILAVAAFISAGIRSVSIYLSGLAGSVLANHVVFSLRVDLYRKFLSLPLGYYHKIKIGEVLARATADIAVMQGLISQILIGFVQYPLTVIVFMGYLLFVNWRLTLIVFLIAPVLVGIVKFFGKKVEKRSERVQDSNSKLTSWYQESLLCLRIVYGFATEKRETERFSRMAKDLYDKSLSFYRWQLGLGPTMDVAVFIVMPAVLILGKVYFQHTLGEILSMMYSFYQVYRPAKMLASTHNQLKTMHGATSRVFEIMDADPSIKDKPDAFELKSCTASIEFNDVSFSYDGISPVLEHINLTINPGELIAFVGKTGSGKSTLLDLIPRLQDVTGGSINIGGIDVRDVFLHSLRQKIGIVNQEVLLFNDTIKNNIAYGVESASDAKIIEASKAAYAHDFILTLPDGYNTIVGDRGSRLSGGQRQRISIARALMKDPEILILDEAASALDAESEEYIKDTIDKLKSSRTILVVAHRLSTVRKADCIYVIEDGRIVESGNQQELLSLGGLFRGFYSLQFRE